MRTIKKVEFLCRKKHKKKQKLKERTKENILGIIFSCEFFRLSICALLIVLKHLVNVFFMKTKFLLHGFSYSHLAINASFGKLEREIIKAIWQREEISVRQISHAVAERIVYPTKFSPCTPTMTGSRFL